MIELGSKVKDSITGFVGVVTARAEYLSGCHQLLVQPPTDDKGEYKEPHWFDEQRVLVDRQTAPIKLDNGATPGFGTPAPKR